MAFVFWFLFFFPVNIKSSRISVFHMVGRHSTVCILHFLYLFVCSETHRLILCIDYCEWCCKKHGCKIFVPLTNFISFRLLPSRRIATIYFGFIWNFGVKSHTVFFDACTNLCSQRLYIKVAVSPCPNQYLYFIFFMVPILTSVEVVPLFFF